MEAGAAENRAMLNGMNFSNLGTRAADHAGITHAQMLAADDQDPTVYKAALVELLVAADRASAEKKMVIELTRRKGDIATAQHMDHHHNVDYKERQAYKDMMKPILMRLLDLVPIYITELYPVVYYPLEPTALALY